MYKKYNLNELAESIQVLKEKNSREGLGEEVELLTLMAKIEFDLRDVKDFAEWCNLRLHDSKKYNEDYKPSDQCGKANFKKYIKNKIEKLSGILERLEEREPRGKWKKEIKKTCKNIKSKTVDIPPRSNEKFGTALGKLLNQSSIDVEMLSHLIDYEVFKIQGYLTGKYKNPSKEFIEEIASFFNIDPRHFREYQEYLGKDYKEDRPITLADYRITKRRREVFELPEQSDEEFKESFRKIIGASGVGEKELTNALHCSTTDLFECWGMQHCPGYEGGKLFKKEFIERIAHFFNISPGYFREYRENEMKDRLLADVIKHKKKKEKGRERQKRFSERNPDKIRERNKRFRENNPGYSKEYYKNNPEKAKEERGRYYERNSEKMKENNKRFKENNPKYFREYYKRNRAITMEGQGNITESIKQ